MVLLSTEELTWEEVNRVWRPIQSPLGWSGCLALATLLRKRSPRDLASALLGPGSSETFAVGDRVWVRRLGAHRRPRLPVPGRLSGAQGRVVKVVKASDREWSDTVLRLGRDLGVEVQERCYEVDFAMADVARYETQGTVRVQIYGSWLQREPEPLPEAPLSTAKVPKRRTLRQILKTLMQEQHDVRAAAAHQHGSREDVERAAVAKELETPGQRLTEALLATTGVAPQGLLRSMELMDSLGIEPLGPRLVARAWRDPSFKAALLQDAEEAIRSLNPKDDTSHAKVKVVESSQQVHNLVVCTLCSCYPASLLGLAPTWYKSQEYRLQAVEKPRELLRSFGLNLPPQVELRVHDSNAELRHLVLPARPAGTEDWSEDELAALVTRDTMIGVAIPVLEKAVPGIRGPWRRRCCHDLKSGLRFGDGHLITIY